MPQLLTSPNAYFLSRARSRFVFSLFPRFSFLFLYLHLSLPLRLLSILSRSPRVHVSCRSIILSPALIVQIQHYVVLAVPPGSRLGNTLPLIRNRVKNYARLLRGFRQQPSAHGWFWEDGFRFHDAELG